jgi:hypothetical protein
MRKAQEVPLIIIMTPTTSQCSQEAMVGASGHGASGSTEMHDGMFEVRCKAWCMVYLHICTYHQHSVKFVRVSCGGDHQLCMQQK